MTEFIFIWIMTIIMSLGMKFNLALTVIKDIFDGGYKLSYSKGKEFVNQMDDSIQKANRLLLLIPVFNILTQIKSAYDYNQQRPFLFDKLRVMNILEEMSPEEIETYNQKPTVTTAFSILLNSTTEIDEVTLNNQKEKTEFDQRTTTKIDKILNEYEKKEENQKGLDLKEESNNNTEEIEIEIQKQKTKILSKRKNINKF